MTKIITIKIDEQLLTKIDALAQQLETTRSEIIRKALAEYIEKLEKLRIIVLEH